MERPTLSKASCVFDLHSTTQVVSRLNAIVLGKSCVFDLHSTTQVVSRLNAIVLGKSCVV
jgi:hypothetical protein